MRGEGEEQKEYEGLLDFPGDELGHTVTRERNASDVIPVIYRRYRRSMWHIYRDDRIVDGTPLHVITLPVIVTHILFPLHLPKTI